MRGPESFCPSARDCVPRAAQKMFDREVRVQEHAPARGGVFAETLAILRTHFDRFAV